MLKRVCDKCGCELEGIEFYRVNTCTVESDGLQASKHEKYDLCEDCFKALLRFLKKEREE